MASQDIPAGLPIARAQAQAPLLGTVPPTYGPTIWPKPAGPFVIQRSQQAAYPMASPLGTRTGPGGNIMLPAREQETYRVPVMNAQTAAAATTAATATATTTTTTAGTFVFVNSLSFLVC